MKIAIVGGFLFPFGDAAGARCRMMALEMKARGADVTVISQLPFVPRPADRGPDGAYAYCGVRYYSSLTRETVQRSYLRSASNILTASCESAAILEREIRHGCVDIVMFTGNFNIYLLPVLRVARKHGKPIVGEILEWFSSFVFYGGFIHPLAWDHELCVRYTNKHLDGLIVISSYLEEYYRQGRREILIVPSLCQYANEKPLSVIDDSTFRIGYFGTPTEKDGIYDLIESVRLLAAGGRVFEFLLAGDDGRAGHLVRVRRIVAENELLRRRMRILGRLPQERIGEVFRECHVLVLSRPDARFSRAGMPQKLSEYMALARPVVVSKVGDIGRYVRDGVDGYLVEPGDSVKFAAAIRRIMDLPDRGRAMGENAWQRGREVFNASTYAERILEFFGRILAKHRGSGQND